MNKPKLIWISGAPGSGKTTLASKLAYELQYLFVDTDAVLESYWKENKDNADYDRDSVGKPRLMKLIEIILHDNVSVVADLVLRKDMDSNLLNELTAQYEVLNIHCKASNASERYYQRELNPDGTEPEWLKGKMPELKELEGQWRDSLDLNIPVLEVNTEDGYSPKFDEIIKFIEPTT